MAEIRINGLANTAQTASNDDYVVLDGATNGTRKMLAKKLTEGVEQQLATTNQNVAQNTEDITDLKADLAELEPGLSAEAKAALLACFAHVAWIDEDGQDYYDALESALYAQADQLTAVFTQGSEKFYPFDSLDSLKANLVVTYTNEQGQSSVVTNYTLTGTLAVGTSRITVGYNGKTAYFNVTVENVELNNRIALGAYTAINTNLRYAATTDPITARCIASIPLKNRDYIISVVDSAKYNIAGHDLENNVFTTFEVYTSTGTETKQGYLKSNDTAASWGGTLTPTGNYVWFFFKKMDGTDFTTDEIENAYGTIYTIS